MFLFYKILHIKELVDPTVHFMSYLLLLILILITLMYILQDHPYIDEKGRRNDTLTSEDSFVTCANESFQETCNQSHRSPGLGDNWNSKEDECAKGDFVKEDILKEENTLKSENCVYEIYKNQEDLPECHIINFGQGNLSDLMTSDESFCPQNEENFLKKFSSMDIKSPSRRKVFTPPVTLPSSLPANLSDLLTSDESFVPPTTCKVNFAKSLNNLALNSPSKVEFVRQWHQQNFPSPTVGQSEDSFDPDETVLYDPYEDLGSINSETTIHYWEDPATGKKLVERHIPSSFCGSSGRPSLNASICTVSTVDSQKTELYDWKCYTQTVDDNENRLSDKEIRQKLQSLGDSPGPITPSTRQTYLTRLKHLQTNATLGQLGITKTLPG